MSGRTKQKKGHNFERIECLFTAKDIENLEIKTIFVNKWIILKNLGRRGEAFCYYVCDKQCQSFATLYVEIGADGMNSVSNQVEFSHKQYSLGLSHRFTNIIDVGLINNHVFYMVNEDRPGPTFKAILQAAPQKLSPETVAFIAIDLITLVEILTSTGYVLRNFDTRQWKMNARSRQFYLADLTDIVVMSDKRYCRINEQHFETADRIDLHWNSEDLTYAPIAFIAEGNKHRMSELDMMEMMVYVIFELAYGKLPWKSCEDPAKTMEMKRRFMNILPGMTSKWEKLEDKWLHTSLQNTLEYMKEARKEQKQLETLPVRDGAWCPNGARAGALISAVKYQEIIDDFRKVVTGGRPTSSIHWRDIRLDWETTFEHTPEIREIVRKLEMRNASLEIARESDRLKGKRVHYSIMKEHAAAELKVNREAVTRYVEGIEDLEDVKVIKVAGTKIPKKKTERKVPVKNTRKKRKIVVKEEDLKVEVEDTPAISVRAARLQRRQQQILFAGIEKKTSEKTMRKKRKVVEEIEEADAPIKIEEPDSAEEEDPFEVKIEEPDEF